MEAMGAGAAAARARGRRGGRSRAEQDRRSAWDVTASTGRRSRKLDEVTGDRFRQPALAGDRGRARRGQQVAGGRPQGGVLDQAALDQPAHLGSARDPGRRLVDHAVDQRRSDPAPNGPSPVAAKARTAPRLKMSLGGPTSRPSACSGDMKPGEPIISPVRVSAAGPGGPEYAEVDQPRPVLGQQDIRGLQVPVDHARGVDRAQALGQPRRQLEHLPGRQRPVHRPPRPPATARKHRRWPATEPGRPGRRRSPAR